MQVLEVQGQSMWPYLRSGEFVSVSELENNSNLQIGDVVLIESPVDLRLHRYLGSGRFKGDNNLHEDQADRSKKIYYLESPKKAAPRLRRLQVLFSRAHRAHTFIKRYPAKLGIVLCGFLLRRLEHPHV